MTLLTRSLIAVFRFAQVRLAAAAGCIALALLLIASPQPVAAQGLFNSFGGASAAGPNPFGFLGNNENAHMWAGSSQGWSVGELQGNSTVGVQSYLFTGNGVWSVIGQGLITNDGNLGGSAGVLRRFYWNDNLLVGLGGFFDVNQSPFDNTFMQVGPSIELLTFGWSMRGNLYLPIGEQTYFLGRRTVGTPGGGFGFWGNSLIRGGQSFNTYEFAMNGGDVEIARQFALLCGEFYGGYYQFQEDGFE